MGKLYFKYGTMGAAKSAEALMCKYRYEETGQTVILLKTAKATRDGETTVKSRVGISANAEILEDFLTSQDCLLRSASADIIIVDEVQFASAATINALARLCDRADVKIICYGLKTDSNFILFEGAKRLFEIADSIEEIKTVCSCGNKAIFNVLIDGDGINGKYRACCRKCARDILIEQKRKEGEGG